MHSRRALLYMPGDDRHKINKSLTLGVDCICMDMEDGVALNRKTEARTTIALALQELDFGRSEKLTRINAVGSGFELDDIHAVLPHHPDGIIIPKVEAPEQIQWASEIIEAEELAQGWGLNSICVLVLVETAKGILNLKKSPHTPAWTRSSSAAKISPPASAQSAHLRPPNCSMRARRLSPPAPRTTDKRLILSPPTLRTWKSSAQRPNSAQP